MNEILSKLTDGRISRVPEDSAYVISWGNWYRGNVPKFHDYTYWNGVNNVPVKLKSMQMAKKVCEDWADLLLNERCDIVLPDGVDRDNFDRIIARTKFWVTANEAVEQSYALGFGALVMSVVDVSIGDGGTIGKDGKIEFQFVNRFNTRILSEYNGRIKEAMFVSVNTDSVDYITHLLEDGKYVIYTHNKNNKTSKVTETSRFETDSEIAWFQIIKPNISSNYIFGTENVEPYISVFANAIDTLMALDNKYDSFDNEFIAGRKRLFVSEEMINVHTNSDKEIRRTFDPRSTTYQILPQNDNKQLIKDESGILRSSEHVEAINMELNLLSNKVGMGEAYYKFNGTGNTTATQIISENSKLFRNLKKQEIPIEYALINLTIALSQASVKYTDTPIVISEDKYHEIKVQFDDSIIEDKSTELNRDKDLVASGLMSPIEFRERWFGEAYDTAVENYRKYFKYDIMTKYLPSLEVGAMTPKEFVMEVYGESNPELEKYIADKVAVGGVQDFWVNEE